jgi:hypothetical protein
MLAIALRALRHRAPRCSERVGSSQEKPSSSPLAQSGMQDPTAETPKEASAAPDRSTPQQWPPQETGTAKTNLKRCATMRRGDGPCGHHDIRGSHKATNQEFQLWHSQKQAYLNDHPCHSTSNPPNVDALQLRRHPISRAEPTLPSYRHPPFAANCKNCYVPPFTDIAVLCLPSRFALHPQGRVRHH